MAKLIKQFDANQHDPSQSAGQLPVGRHKVIIKSSEVKATAANDGGYLQLNLEVVEGPQLGSTGAHRLNLYHSKEQTVQIAEKQFSSICHVVGVFQVADSGQLHNIPFFVEVGLQKEPNEKKYTEVKKVFDVNGNEPGQQNQQPQQTQVQQSTEPTQIQQPVQPQQAQVSTPPWGGGAPTQSTEQPTQLAESTPPWGGQAQTNPASTPPWGNGG